MISLSRILLGLGLLAFIACGGGSKEADTTPAGDDMAATPVAAEGDGTATPTEGTEVAEAAAPAEAAGGEGAGDGGSICDNLCGEILTCAKQMSGKDPTEEEQSQFTQACTAKCVQEDPNELEQAAACIAEHKGDCAGLFPCLEKIESKQE